MITVQKNSGTSFQWITKSTNYSRSDADITISLGKTNNKPRMQMTIRNKQFEHFPSGYVMFCIDWDKLYIAESDSRTGFKLTGNNQTDFSRYVQCGDEVLTDWARTHIGDYRLDKDSKSGLYYVDAKRRTE